MKDKRISTTIISFFVLGVISFQAASLEGANWPTFRGPVNTGIAPDADPPVSWSETENIKWKVEVPGTGLSSPVIWGDKIFFLTAIETKKVEAPAETPPAQEARPQRPDQGPPPAERGGRGERGAQRGSGRGGGGGGRRPTSEYSFEVVCMDRGTGKLLWQTKVKEALPHEGHHQPDGSFAAYSPVTDGKLVWASFGSRGLYCLDVDGNIKWNQDLVKQRTRAGFGEGSSPAIAGDAVIVVSDHEDQSYIYAFNKVSGKPLWKKERDEKTGWSSPVAVEVDGKTQIIVNGTNFVRAYDLETGDIIWKCSGQTVNVIPTPVIGFGNVYCTSGYRGSALYAIELGKTGDLTGSDAVRWRVDEATPYVPSPILTGDKIYVCQSNKEVISCYQAKDGKPNYIKQALEGVKGVYASPVGAKDRIYVAGRNGVTAVLRVSDTFEVLATNTLDDKIDATPAIVGNEIYIKGKKYVYCIAEQ